MTASTGEDRAPSGAPGTEEEVRYDDIPADTFALRLVMARHHAGRLSIEKAAAMCGINSGNWAHWEDGRLPRDRPDVCFKIHRGLRMDLQWLLYGGPLLGPHGRPAKRSGEDTARYRKSPLVPASRTVRPLEARLIARVDPQAPILTSMPGRRANRVNPVQPAEVIYGR